MFNKIKADLTSGTRQEKILNVTLFATVLIFVSFFIVYNTGLAIGETIAFIVNNL